MATQIFKTNAGVNDYIVISNTAAQSFPTLSAASHIGYDTVSVVPDLGATPDQMTNPYTNGTLPDCVKNATSIATGLVLATLRYRNPA